jgi:hypothetical protein
MVVVGLLQAPVNAGEGAPCTNRVGDGCGGVTADQAEGDFHGLIMVNGDPSVLAAAARSGTQPGCGDCTWTIVLACLANLPGQQQGQTSCGNAVNGRSCKHGQIAYRLFLTTKAVTNELVNPHLCLGGLAAVIPVGDVAAADVDRYLKNVVPPRMRVTVQPPGGVLTGLPAYFQTQSPAIQPQRFGGPQVVENITVTPAHYTWQWGDGSGSLHTDDPGGPYPDGHVTHTYDRATHLTVALTTEWSATYTITVAGQTFGPYDATGTVQRTQRFPLVVDRARSHLVSH